MAEQTQTEKLREKLTIVSDKCYSQELSACPTHPIFQPQKFINLALQVGKEEGLKFTKVGVRGEDLEGAYICQVEEIEI